MSDDAPYVWLSYPEAAAALGLSARAVEGRAYRGGWKKQKGNDGTVRLAVPVALLAPTQRGDDVGSDPMRGPTRGSTEAHASKAVLDELKASYDRLVDELRQRVEAAEALASQRTSELTAQHERAGRAEGEAAALLREVEAIREAIGREQGRASAEQRARATAEAERDAALSELAGWTAGRPLARAWRALRFRPGRM